MCTIAVAQAALALGGIQPSEAAIFSNSSAERGRTVARQLAHDEISAVERVPHPGTFLDATCPLEHAELT